MSDSIKEKAKEISEELKKPAWIRQLEGAVGLKTLRDLDIPPQEPLVDGLIYTGQLVWLSGSAGVQKSLLSTCLAKCMALGQDFLDLKTTESRGGIFDGEMHPSINPTKS